MNLSEEPSMADKTIDKIVQYFDENDDDQQNAIGRLWEQMYIRRRIREIIWRRGREI